MQGAVGCFSLMLNEWRQGVSTLIIEEPSEDCSGSSWEGLLLFEDSCSKCLDLPALDLWLVLVCFDLVLGLWELFNSAGGRGFC